MDSQQPAANQDWIASDRRRSKRFPLAVAVSLKWKGADGLPVEAEARAVEGNSYGGFLEIPKPLPLGTQAALSNLHSRQTLMVKVVSVRYPKPDTVGGIAVEFLSPNNTFWDAAGNQEWAPA